uniref:Maturase K n=1 Tax=Monotropa uniflora TaxID=50148 RepID=A0A894K2H6_MONUN|nr:maturase K [Monotropa uniflora]
MDKLKLYLYLNIYQQDNLIYPLLLQEYIYALVHDRNFKNGSIFFENIFFENEYSLLIIKRLITQIYHHNFYISFFHYFLKQKIIGYVPIYYSKNIWEGFVVIVEIIFYLRLLAFIEKNKIVKYLNLQSIHSIFPFLEDNFKHLTYVLDLLISHPIHIEVFIGILRYWLKDTSVLHLLRSFFHEYSTVFNFIIFNKYNFYLKKKKQRLLLLLYNVYVFEYESIFFFLRNQSYNLGSIAYKNFSERIYFYQKIELEIFNKKMKSILWTLKDPLMHYVGYKEIFIIASKSNFFFMNKWKFYMIHFWQSYFYVWFNIKRININKLSNHSFNFIGYLASFSLDSSIIEVNMIENSFITRKSFNKFETLIPINPLIQSLYKSGFCNSFSNPTSKLAWIKLADSTILNQFSYIYRNIFHYHSGSLEKKKLYLIKYILKLSCARTLTFKHKSTVNTFIKKVGLQLFESFFMEESQFLYLIFSKNYLTSGELYKNKIWYLDIIAIHELSDR